MLKIRILTLLTFIAIVASSQPDSIPVVNIDTLKSATDTIPHYQRVDDGANLQIEEFEDVYKINKSVDIPIFVIGAGWSGYAFTKIYSKDPSPLSTIQNLRVEDINQFDRWAADVYSESAAKASDFLFYGSMPLPLLFLADPKIRQDFGKIGFMYLEAMSITGLLYTGSVYIWDRYRPLAYNNDVPMDERLRGGAKNSFFAGHVALVGTSTFFMAKVYSDYHPESKLGGWLFGAAGVATGMTGYLRHRAGKHFPSDVILGTAVGTLSGILVPHFHKNKKRNSNLVIMPYAGRSSGMYLSYRF